MWWHKIIFVFIGLGGGFIAAGGVFALLTIIGIVTRLAKRTQTDSYVKLYENVIIVGAVTGNVLSIYRPVLGGNNAIISVYGVFTGAFVGCLAIALAESLKVTSVCMRRIDIGKSLKIILIFVMLGKVIGSLLYYFYFI